ncbi:MULTISPECIES: hypothetical protein [Streptomyces]|uniref:Ferredoxin n=1 Tax=Streptomyces dengpaensis TaxID=2049881 RepID=A0ABM6STK2_9ACTN|nr:MULTISPECIES: hypothetical protein [Streptomyces]AVH57900.1 hypothetical protein C4B68_21410 [Streptomyces dengpaensis]PIB03917.1 hypothetical protein B1C81_35310 [Streptomyces sp. HG99]
MTDRTDTAPAWGKAALPLPSVDALSEEQLRGAACVWCKTPLTAETAVNLGERRVRIRSSHTTAFPRGCRRHAGEAAYRALLDHAPSCEQCVDNADRCDTNTALRHLIREGRR